MSACRRRHAKNSASISARDRTPRNCAWLPSSVQSFGAGVAVAQSLYGVATKASSSVCRVFAAWCLIMLDSSSTTHRSANVKLMQPVVIRDGDARSNVCAFAGVRHGNADAFSFLDRLLGDGERRKDQHIAASLTVDPTCRPRPNTCRCGFCQGRYQRISQTARAAAPMPIRSRWCGTCRSRALARRCLCARRAEFRAYKFVIFQRRLQESMPANNAVNRTGENPPARYLSR